MYLLLLHGLPIQPYRQNRSYLLSILCVLVLFLFNWYLNEFQDGIFFPILIKQIP